VVAERKQGASLDRYLAAREKGKKTSQFVGVMWIERLGKWQAQIGINGKRISLGLWDEEEEAGKMWVLTKEKEQPTKELADSSAHVPEAEMIAEMIAYVREVKAIGMRQNTIATEAAVNGGKLSQFLGGKAKAGSAALTLKKLNVWRAHRLAGSRTPATGGGTTTVTDTVTVANQPRLGRPASGAGAEGAGGARGADHVGQSSKKKNKKKRKRRETPAATANQN
jgi:hypothetical protein